MMKRVILLAVLLALVVLALVVMLVLLKTEINFYNSLMV